MLAASLGSCYCSIPDLMWLIRRADATVAMDYVLGRSKGYHIGNHR